MHRQVRLSSLLFLLMSTTAYAQSAEDGSVVLPPISVEGAVPTATSPVQGYVAPVTGTATKTDTPLIETPQSISVITRDQLDDRAVQSITEALGYTAGTFSGTIADPRFDDPNIRGFSAGSNQYLDGLRILRTLGAPAVEQYGLERVEVLRGPSSVLYGQSVPGGLVNMVSKRPTDQSFGEVNLQAGSHDRYQGSFDLGGALDAEKQLTYRLTALGRKSDTQMDYVEDDRIFVAPALTWKPNSDTRLTLLGRFQHDEAQSPPGLPAIGTLLRQSAGRDFDQLLSGRADVPGFGTGTVEHRLRLRAPLQRHLHDPAERPLSASQLRLRHALHLRTGGGPADASAGLAGPARKLRHSQRRYHGAGEVRHRAAEPYRLVRHRLPALLGRYQDGLRHGAVARPVQPFLRSADRAARDRDRPRRRPEPDRRLCPGSGEAGQVAADARRAARLGRDGAAQPRHRGRRPARTIRRSPAARR